MRVFIYEYVTGGGMWREDSSVPPSGSLLAEGSAMIRALAADFLKCDGTQVWALRDERLKHFQLPGCSVRAVASAKQEQTALCELSADADWTVLIAPEFDNILLQRCRQVESCGARLLSPPSAMIAEAADKHRTAQLLKAAGVPTPESALLQRGQRLPCNFPYPAVLKPRDGAGSLGVQFVSDADFAYEEAPIRSDLRLERFCAGMPASVAMLCGPGQFVTLPACRQRLTGDGRFQYLGGSLPLPKQFGERAAGLARSAIRALPPAVGYVGVDLVLGDDSQGRDDVVIEVNPRLTTSYVGLRASARTNLAAAMIEFACGRQIGLSFEDQPIKFNALGVVQ
jgi:hypothetical protein